MGVHLPNEEAEFIRKKAMFKQIGISTLLRNIIEEWIQKEVKT